MHRTRFASLVVVGGIFIHPFLGPRIHINPRPVMPAPGTAPPPAAAAAAIVVPGIGPVPLPAAVPAQPIPPRFHLRGPLGRTWVRID